MSLPLSLIASLTRKGQAWKSRHDVLLLPPPTFQRQGATVGVEMMPYSNTGKGAWLLVRETKVTICWVRRCRVFVPHSHRDCAWCGTFDFVNQRNCSYCYQLRLQEVVTGIDVEHARSGALKPWRSLLPLRLARKIEREGE